MMTLIATTTTTTTANGAAATGTDMGGALTLMTVGMLVVLFTLTLIAVLVLLLRRALAERTPANSPPTPVASAGAGEATSGIDPHHIVVISAAVAATVGRAKIHRITMLGREAGRQWVTEGRVVVMGSHHLHR